MKLKFTVREIVESAMLIALAIVLDFDGLKIHIGMNGGSISFTMVPLVILALRVGPLKGFIGIGVVYGFLTCLKDGWGLQTFPLDYLLAYGSLSVIGFFRNIIFDNKKKLLPVLVLTLSTLLSVALRYVFACLSSIILYEFDLVGALIYNATYIPLSGAITIVVLLVLFKPLKLVNEKFPIKSIC